jgi:hypothetical protein
MRKYGRAVTEPEWEKERAAIHVAAGAHLGGVPISSKDLTDEQFKEVKRRFRTWFKPADLQAQIDAEIQDYIRWRWRADELLDRIEASLQANERQAEAAPIARGPARDGYLLAMFRRIGKLKDFAAIETASKGQMHSVMAALVYRFDQVARKKPGKGKLSPKRNGKPSLQRAFDEPMKDTRSRPARKPVNLPACVKPVVLAEPEDDGDPF